MEEKHPRYGENPHYDAQVEKESAARRALELTVVERHRQEQELIEARKALARAKEAQEKARIVYQQDRDRLKTKGVLAKNKYDEAKAAVLAAKRAVTEADQALRSGRRASNSRMQEEAPRRTSPDRPAGMGTCPTGTCLAERAWSATASDGKTVVWRLVRLY